MGRENIKTSERIVLKLGTRVLTESDNSLDYPVIKSIVKQISELARADRQLIIVTSAAIALGLSRMGMTKRPQDIALLQAAASMGQSRLMHAYETEFAKCGCETSQILLTYEDIQNRKKYLNIRNTIFTLWSFGTIPIVNENDTVSFTEIRFGDNDLLAAYLANMIDADLLVILTDIEGLYNKDPKEHSESVIVSEVEKIDEKLMKSVGSKGSFFSSGGMESKLKAAKIATAGGIGAIIASGKSPRALENIFKGQDEGTYFSPSKKKIKGKKRWIAFSPRVSGRIVIDKGGEHAIVTKKKSLLPVGIRDVFGSFDIGSNIAILNEENKEIARGLTNFSSEEIMLIKGMNTKKIPDVLGVDIYFEEVVHRDNLVILV
ncbi:MAG: glutamate 5-kinase [Spirochaetota bacterium]|nr:MAG: glutamate 5-kinase [Spirochaetota bacterium]